MTGKFDILKEYFYGSAYFGVNYENNDAYRIVKYLNFIRNKLDVLNKKLGSDVDTVLHTNSRISTEGFLKNASNRIIFLLETIGQKHDVEKHANELVTLISGSAADYFDFEELKRMGIELTDKDLKRFKYLFENHALVVSTLVAMGG